MINDSIEKINTFNKLMIETIKDNKDTFKFDDKYYTVYSDGVCVQTLINNMLLYRISINNPQDNILTSKNLLNYLKN